MNKSLFSFLFILSVFANLVTLLPYFLAEQDDMIEISRKDWFEVQRVKDQAQAVLNEMEDLGELTEGYFWGDPTYENILEYLKDPNPPMSKGLPEYYDRPVFKTIISEYPKHGEKYLESLIKMSYYSPKYMLHPLIIDKIRSGEYGL